MKNYPEVKVFLWRFVRVFLAAYITQMTVYGFDYTNLKSFWISLVTGAIAAFAKVVRDELEWKRLPL